MKRPIPVMANTSSRRAARRKTVRLDVVVTVPAWMTEREAAREVRTLIANQINWSADPGDVRVRRCGPQRKMRRSIEAAADVGCP